MAPQAPDLVPSMAPTVGGVAGPNVSVPVDAFGGAVGHALEGMGQGIEHASDRIWEQAVKIQGLQNETAAKNADADYIVAAGKADADFMAKGGVDAGAGALANHIDNLRTLRTQIRGTLGNMQAQTMFDGSSLANMGSMVRLAAGHSARQVRVAAGQAADARIQSTQDAIEAHPTDDNTYQRGKAAIRSEVESKGRNLGMPQEAIDELGRQTVSQTLARRFTGLAKQDAIGAQTMADQAIKKGDLIGDDITRVQNTVQTQFRQQGARIISQQVLGGRANGQEDEKTEQEYVDDAMKAADVLMKKTGIQDDFFKDFVKQRTMTEYGQDQRIKRDLQQSSEQTVASAMMTGNKEGILPKSVDELKLINPDVSAAWDNMKPTTQKKYMHEMALNAIGHRVAWNDENLKTYRSIKGQATDNPTEFLARDVISENIPSSAKHELINLQQRMTKQSQDDPRVARAMAILQPDLNAASITRGAAGSTAREEYYQFVGGLQDALEFYKSNNPNKVPSTEEVRAMGAQLMQEQATGRRGYLYFTDESKQPLYKLPVKDEDADRIKRLDVWQKRGIAEPTDAMVQRFYHAEKFKELFGKSAKKPEAGQ